MKNILIVLTTAFVFNACIKEIEIPIPNDNPRQVINCLFTEGETFKVEITNSIPILNEEFSYINNATVVLFENDVEIETLQYQGTIYKSIVQAQPDKTYKIKATATDFDQIITQDKMPNQPIITNIDFIEEAYYDSNYEGIFGKTSITIEDDGSQTNYYEILIVRKFYSDDEIVTSPTSIEVTSDPVVSNELEVQRHPTHLVFTDKLFNGNIHTIDFDFDNHYNEDDSSINYKVIINSISENYYLYKRRLNRHTNFQEGYVDDIFIEPVQMFTNVENGFGIFAGYNEYSQMFYH